MLLLAVTALLLVAEKYFSLIKIYHRYVRVAVVVSFAFVVGRHFKRKLSGSRNER